MGSRATRTLWLRSYAFGGTDAFLMIAPTATNSYIPMAAELACESHEVFVESTELFYARRAAWYLQFMKTERYLLPSQN